MTRLERAVVQAAAHLAQVTAEATQRRDEAIAALVASGASLRHIAALAGVSHTQVRRIQQRKDG